MRIELKAEGKNVHILSINSIDAKDDQKALTDKAAFPIFQDNEDVKAWERHQGGKDDFFIYNAKGKLVAFLPASGTVSVDLSTDEGYKNVKQALLKAIE